MSAKCPTKKINFINEQKKEEFEHKLNDHLEVILNEGVPSTNGIKRECEILDNGDILVKTLADDVHFQSLDILIQSQDAYFTEVSTNDICCM